MNWRAEMVRIFQQRLHLLSSITLLCLPAFALGHALLSPSTRRNVAVAHLILLAACVAARVLAPRLRSLSKLRALTFAAYAVYFAGAGVICTQVAAPSAGSPISNQFLALSAYAQIILSILVLPVAAGEVAVLAGFGLASMAVAASVAAGHNAEHGYGDPMYLSHLFAFVLTSSLVGCLAHLSALQRRAAFEAAWNLGRSAAQLEKISTLDPVTGGWNRRRIEAVLREEITRAGRFGRHFSVLMFDLDNFKSVNDTHGHAAGDDVLRAVHASAVETVRATDTVARFGGDEFVVVLPETTREAALAMAARLQAQVRVTLGEQWPPDSAQAAVTLSVGIAHSEDIARPTVAGLLAGADERLYNAKRGGKNRITG